jgi:ankyrin repeat protein
MAKKVLALKREKYEEGLDLLDACIDDISYAKYLLKNGSQSLNWKDSLSGISILHTLVYNDLWQSALLLLEFGADPNIYNKVTFFV